MVCVAGPLKSTSALPPRCPALGGFLLEKDGTLIPRSFGFAKIQIPWSRIEQIGRVFVLKSQLR